MMMAIDKEKQARTKQRWASNHRGARNEQQAWYRAGQLERLASWARTERAEIKKLFDEAIAKSAPGLPLEVDHYYQLAGLEDVCGLHCLANLRIIPRYENRLVWSIKERRHVRRG